MIPFLQVFSVKTMLGAPLNVKTLKFDDNQYCTHGTKLLLLLHSVLSLFLFYFILSWQHLYARPKKQFSITEHNLNGNISN